MQNFVPGIYVNEYGSIAVVVKTWAICVHAFIYFNGHCVEDKFEVFVDGGHARFYFEDTPGHLQKFESIALHCFENMQ